RLVIRPDDNRPFLRAAGVARLAGVLLTTDPRAPRKRRGHIGHTLDPAIQSAQFAHGSSTFGGPGNGIQWVGPLKPAIIWKPFGSISYTTWASRSVHRGCRTSHRLFSGTQSGA